MSASQIRITEGKVKLETRNEGSVVRDIAGSWRGDV